MALGRGRADGVCQARECNEQAVWTITWSNPKIPWADSKTWLSCNEHREFLSDYMKYRGFPCEINPLDPTDQPDAYSTSDQ